METSRKNSELRLNVRYNGRQMEFQKKNLVAVCRLSVKSLIDASCSEPILDDIPAVQNFCIILEHILSHRFKAHNTWYGSNDSRTFWEFIRTTCKRMPHNCLANIQAVEQYNTSRGKGRAWIRMALMEKRLAEYLAAAIQQNKVLKSFYYEGATILSEDFQVLVGVILGLNAIDFSFDLRHMNLDFPTLPVIDFTPYLKFEQGQEEEPVLPVLMGDTVPKEKFNKLEENYRILTEQKGYIEELVRLRESQIEEIQRNQNRLVATLKHYENESRRERRELESVIIELQAQLSAMKQEQENARVIVQTHAIHYDPLLQVVTQQQQQQQQHQTHHHQPQVTLSLSDVSDSPTNCPGSETRLKQPWSDNRSILSADNRSVLSGSSISVNREDTQSMEPLAGSFTSDRSFLSNQMPPAPTAVELGSGDSTAANQDADDTNVTTEDQSGHIIEQEHIQPCTEKDEQETTPTFTDVTEVNGQNNDNNESSEIIAPVFVAINDELKGNKREDSPKPDLVAGCESAKPSQQDEEHTFEDDNKTENLIPNDPQAELEIST